MTSTMRVVSAHRTAVRTVAAATLLILAAGCSAARPAHLAAQAGTESVAASARTGAGSATPSGSLSSGMVTGGGPASAGASGSAAHPTGGTGQPDRTATTARPSTITAGTGPSSQPSVPHAASATDTSASGPASGSATTQSTGSGVAVTLVFAHCMQSHGVPSFPDPVDGSVSLTHSGLDPASPSFQAALNGACRSLAPTAWLSSAPVTR